MKDIADKIAEQTKQLKDKYAELYDAFKAGEYKGVSPKNEIEIVFNGTGKLKSLTISPDFDTSNRPLLEAVMFIAFNAACDAYNQGYQNYQKQVQDAENNFVRDYTAKTLKEYAPQGIETPKIQWGGTKKIDGEEN